MERVGVHIVNNPAMLNKKPALQKRKGFHQNVSNSGKDGSRRRRTPCVASKHSWKLQGRKPFLIPETSIYELRM
jgi:hypothetical protein